jgi:hypothetical protein
MRKFIFDRHSRKLLSGIWIPAFAGMTLLLAVNLLSAAPHAFPVPYVPKDGHINITFTNLPGSGSIKIFTINGEEVASLSVAPGELIKNWPVTNKDGKKLATGVYLYIVDGGGEKTTGKLVVIR